MKNDIAIKFVDFWPTFDHHNNNFVEALRTKFNVRVIDARSDEIPDLLFYSRCGTKEHYNYKDCVKIYYTGENDVPNFNECDYAISFYNIDFGKRHLRYPLYKLYEFDMLQNPVLITDEEAVKRPFCSVLLRNTNNCDPKRLEIIDAVDSYKPLAYGGPYRNNVGGSVEEKIPFISGYKFNLALENSIADGYVTEKIVEPMAASTVPVYWGCPTACKDFNPEAFINVNDFSTLDSFVKYLKKVDNDPDLYLKILRSPKLNKDTSPDFDSQLADFLCDIAEGKKKHVIPYGEQNNMAWHNYNLNEIRKSNIAYKLGRALAKIF